MNSFQIVELPVETCLLKSRVIHFERLDSTNAYLLNRHPHPSGTVVWADFQSAGRGRLGRTWIAPRDEALLFSVFLKIQESSNLLYIFPFLAAVSVLEALKTIVTPGWLALKWPNDVMLKNKKICGILVQSKTHLAKSADVVIGIGLNVNQPVEFFQSDLPFAGSLFSLTGQKFDRQTVLVELIRSIDQNLVDLNESSRLLFCANGGNIVRILGTKSRSMTAKNTRRYISGCYWRWRPDFAIRSGKSCFPCR
jgi:BirA family biotin operon repressor/biotin-[acetyl-CoA-carboxylase] ligase